MFPDRREFFARAAGTVLGACASASLASVAEAQAGSVGRDVPWLRDVLEPPAGASVPSRPLGPLGPESAVATLDGWRRHRPGLLEAWRDVLGPVAAERARPPAVEVIAEDQVGDVV